MIRKQFFISQEKNDFLEELNEVSVSEHIRRAIDEYIEKKKKQNGSFSQSRKGDETHG